MKADNSFLLLAVSILFIACNNNRSTSSTKEKTSTLSPKEENVSYSQGDTNLKTNIGYDTSILLRNADNYYQKKQYSEAKLSFDTLVLINPINGEYYHRRGFCKLMLLNDDEGAIEDFFSAVKYNYSNKRASYLNIGTIHRSHGEYDSAIYFYNKALEIDPKYEKATDEKNQVLRIIKKSNRPVLSRTVST